MISGSPQGGVLTSLLRNLLEADRLDEIKGYGSKVMTYAVDLMNIVRVLGFPNRNFPVNSTFSEVLVC